MNKRFFVGILFLMLLAVPMQAALVKCLVVQLSSNAKLYYPTSRNPVASFEGTVMHLNTDVMDISTVAKLTVEMVELVGVQTETIAENAPVNDGQSLLFQTTESEVAIFNMSGLRMEVTMTKQGDLHTIDLSRLPSSTYLLRAGKQSWKFIKH